MSMSDMGLAQICWDILGPTDATGVLIPNDLRRSSANSPSYASDGDICQDPVSASESCSDFFKRESLFPTLFLDFKTWAVQPIANLRQDAVAAYLQQRSSSASNGQKAPTGAGIRGSQVAVEAVEPRSHPAE